MRALLQLLLYLVGVPLEALVITSMVRTRAWRAYPLVFAYSIALFAASLVELGAYAFYAYIGARRGPSRAFYYWFNEGVLQVLMFAAVISLIYVATASLENRTMLRRALVGGAILFAPLSFALHYSPSVNTGTWATLVSRDLNLCSAILDLALWTILLLFRRGDYRLLMVSGGLGLQFTGEAIGHSLREISRSTIMLGSLVVVLADLACLFVWWQAFRKPVLEKASGRVDARPACES